jgi:cellulose synthase/poly-beta-1,6-N-acetylglucosamine synthase-like glycosyltransferase
MFIPADGFGNTLLMSFASARIPQNTVKAQSKVKRRKHPMKQQAADSPALHPLISVVIPCYNQSQFLADAIESVLRQTWPDVELIVVDDGSTDATRLVAQQFAAVRYLHQSNQGLSAARNAGLALSTGQFVAFLDSDDRLLPRGLECGAGYLMAHPQCAFVHGDYRRIAEDGSLTHITNTGAT